MRVLAQPMLCALPLVILCGTLPTMSSRADDPPKVLSGESRLANGRVVEYTVHFDRNSLRDSVRLGDGLIALTSSGSLLRFELPMIRLVRERIATEEVACLGRGEGETVLAGLADGRVCRVDPTKLELTEVVKFPFAPQWVGWGIARGTRPAGLVVVTQQAKSVQVNGKTRKWSYSVVNDLATGKTFALEHKVTTILLDSEGRLWLGADMGEWGGHVARVDLSPGTLSEVKPPPSRNPGFRASWAGVYGFVELSDGQVWAFGGSSHMGFNSGSVTRIDEAEPHPLFAFDPPREGDQEPDPGRPRLPITHIVEESDSLLVFSYSDVFRVDKVLKHWKRAATLEIQYRWGRPDAVGAYPSLCAIHPPRRLGEPYLLATVADGYVALRGEKVTPHGLPGQLGPSSVDRVENTSEGTIYFEGGEENSSWRFGAKGWKIVSLAPPVEPDPAGEAAEFEADETSWDQTSVVVGAGGTIYTVSSTGVTPGTRTTGRRVDGKTVRLGRETSSLDPSATFLTADGTLWNACYGELTRFEKDRWVIAAQLPERKSPSRLETISTNGPPWLLLDRFDHALWRLEHGAHGEAPRLTRIEIREVGKAPRIDDAIPWSDGTLLLATEFGLRAYAPATRKLSRVDIPEPAQPATTLARDGRGRLWLGGSGLWMAEPGAKHAEAFDRVPCLGRTAIEALCRDPRHDDGVIVALGARGVVFIRAKPEP